MFIFVKKINQVEQKNKEKLDRSASYKKLDRPTSENMPGKHQPISPTYCKERDINKHPAHRRANNSAQAPHRIVISVRTK